MLCDEVIKLDAYGWTGLDDKGKGLVDMYLHNMPNTHKFFLTDDFFQFSSVKYEQFGDYVEKISPLVKLPYNPTWLEFRENGGRGGYLLDNIEDAILVIRFMEIDVNGKIGMQCTISIFHPMSIKKSEDGSHTIGGDFFLMKDFKPHADSLNQMVYENFRIMDILARINSPAITEIEKEPDMSLLNKARQKRGKTPLFSYKILKLNKDICSAIKERKSIEKSHKVRMHWVRGHFKVRKNGIYWWNPHLAGHKELGFSDKSYVA